MNLENVKTDDVLDSIPKINDSINYVSKIISTISMNSKF